MSPVVESDHFNGSLADHLLHLSGNLGKIFSSSPSEENSDKRGASNLPVDILETTKEFVFYFDVPGLSKSDIQVTLEDDRTLVVKNNNGKRKREDGEDEGCKYLRLERKAAPKFLRKFRLPENCNTSAISAKCENGVLTVTVEKLPPPPKSKTVEVTVS